MFLFYQIACALRVSKSLRSLSLRTNEICDDHRIASTASHSDRCFAIAFNKAERSSIISGISSSAGATGIGSNTRGGGGISALTAALCVNTTLASLSLSANQLGDESAVQFANLLRTNATLTSMSLSNNDVGDTGGIFVACMQDP
jgi:hypothetical protein